jgi:c-di-GMP-binding flagellar brake protein YcgR
MTDTRSNRDAECDRRQFFRIDDTVRLQIQPLSAAELAAGVANLERGFDGNFTVMSSLAAVTAQMAASMRRIDNSDPDVAAYLRALDQKIEILGRAFLAQESELISSEHQSVNLSAGGVSLCAHHPMEVGQGLEIRMLLYPSFTGLLSFGEVIGCVEMDPDANDGYAYQLRVEFVHMREQDREILIRHVLHRQSEILRARREQASKGKPGGD